MVRPVFSCFRLFLLNAPRVSLKCSLDCNPRVRPLVLWCPFNFIVILCFSSTCVPQVGAASRSAGCAQGSFVATSSAHPRRASAAVSDLEALMASKASGLDDDDDLRPGSDEDGEEGEAEEAFRHFQMERGEDTY